MDERPCPPSQPGYLTLSGLLVSYCVYGGAGYYIAGRVGFWCGAGIVTVLYARHIWLAILAQVTGGSNGQGPTQNAGSMSGNLPRPPERSGT